MRVHRMISILLLVEAKGRIKAKELAEELETSVRTIYRDVDALCEAGIPLTTDTGPNGGIHFLEGYTVGIKNLNGEDIINLYLNGMGVKADKQRVSVLKNFEIYEIEEDENYIEATINMFKYDFAKYDILEIIGYAEVLKPAELRNYVEEELSNILRKYNQGIS